MKRTAKYLVVATPGTPQPMIGTNLAAAIPAGQNVVAQVTDSTMFVGQDYVVLQTTLGLNKERCRIIAIPDGTHITLQQVNQAHALNEWVSLAGGCAEIGIQTKDGNVGNIYIGNSPTFNKGTGVGMLFELSHVAAGNQPPDYFETSNGPMDAEDMSNYWIDADNNTDKYLPMFGVI